LKLSKEKECELVGRWSKSIINHMYWCAMSTSDGDGDIMKAKWISIANHIHNIHTHSGVFPKCAHPILRQASGRRKKWLKKGYTNII
jgi:solute carrier family 8 (sodium/calcium exchanger)